MLITPLTSHLGPFEHFLVLWKDFTSCLSEVFVARISAKKGCQERGSWTLVWCLLLWNSKLSVMSAAFLTQAILLHLGIMIDSGRFPLCSFSSRYFSVSPLSSFSQITCLHECLKEGLSPKLWTNCVFFMFKPYEVTNIFVLKLCLWLG